MKSYKASCSKEQFTYLKKSISGGWMVRFDVEDVEDGRVRYSETTINHKPSYNELVELLIAQRYSRGAESAVQRQRDTKREEFYEYYKYCEDCKAEAKKIIGLDGQSQD